MSLVSRSEYVSPGAMLKLCPEALAAGKIQTDGSSWVSLLERYSDFCKGFGKRRGSEDRQGSDRARVRASRTCQYCRR